MLNSEVFLYTLMKILGALLILAGLGYMIDGFGRVLFADYSLNLALYTFVGEVVLIFWLLVRGWRIEEESS
jgi:formate hydrogenlyase subunit 3/multisubunit Na+/H+ antiporter MnhD subunit